MGCCSYHMRVHECVPSRTISFTYLHKFLGQTTPSTSKSTPCCVALLFGFLVAAVCFAVVLARTCSLLWFPTHTALHFIEILILIVEKMPWSHRRTWASSFGLFGRLASLAFKRRRHHRQTQPQTYTRVCTILLRVKKLNFN